MPARIDSPKVKRLAAEVAERGTKRALRYSEERIKSSVSGGQPPSEPGEPPHLLTGKLRASIRGRLMREGADLIGRVTAEVPYAKFLEFGTPKGRMQARPFLRPFLKSKQSHADLLRIMSGKK